MDLSLGLGLNHNAGAFAGDAGAFSNLYSVLLDGISDNVTINPTLTALSATTEGTFLAWIKPTAAINYNLIGFGDTAANNAILFHTTSTGRLRLQINSSGNKCQTTTNATAITAGSYSLVGVTQESSVAAPILYVDGVKPAQSNGTSTDNTLWFNSLPSLNVGRLGCWNYNGSGDASFYSGNMDQVIFVNRALTAGQMLDVYNAGCPKDEVEIANGISQFIFDGDTVPTATDSIGGHNGTYVSIDQSAIEAVVPC